MKRNHGFSRTVPVIRDEYVITIGPQGHVMCCDPVTGDLKWGIDMAKAVLRRKSLSGIPGSVLA